jgi:hypothetical protein
MTAQLACCWTVGAAGPGAPGGTTLAVALATLAGGLLVEADVDGGALAARYGCWLNDRAPSLASLVTSLRPGVTPAAVADHIQRLPAGTRAVLGAPTAEEATGPVEQLAAHLHLLRAAAPGQTVVVDAGRLRPASPADEFAAQADALVVVARPTVESLVCLLPRLPTLAGLARRIVVAVRGDGPYRLGDIAAEARGRAGAPIAVLAIPEDVRAVEGLAGRRGGRLDRTALMRATSRLHAVLESERAKSAERAMDEVRS